MTSPGPTRQPAAMHVIPAISWHANRHPPRGQRGSPGLRQSYGAMWPGAWAAQTGGGNGLPTRMPRAAACVAGQAHANLNRKTGQRSPTGPTQAAGRA